MPAQTKLGPLPSDCLYVVTGGAGFIGSHLVEELVNGGHRVRVFDDFSTGKRANIAPFADRIEVVEGTVTNPADCERALDGARYVFHHAALASVPASVRDPIRNNAINVTGTVNVLEAARKAGVRRVVYAASSAAYGNRPETVKSEDLAPAPLSPYAVAKLAGEHYLRAYHEVYGLETVALRYFNVFGPRQDPQSEYAAVIPRFITALLEGRRPVVYGTGMQSRDFIYIANNVAANFQAILAPNAAGQMMNIACGTSNSLLDLLAALGRVLGRDPNPVFEPGRAGDVMHSLADISRAKELIDYEPIVSFDEGLARTVDWYRSNMGKA